MPRSVLWVGVGLGCVAAAPSAAARDLAHTVQLSLDGTLASYETVTSTYAAQTGLDSLGYVTDTTPPAVTTTNSSFSLMGSGFGLGLGYALSDHLLLGAQLQLAHGKLEQSTSMQVLGDDSSTGVSFLPRVEYIFGGPTARPYLVALVGVEHASTDLSSADSGAALTGATVTDSTTEFRFGCGFGVHAFLNDYFSIDPALTFLGEFGSGHDTLDYSTSGVLLVASVDLSAWLGGHPQPKPAESDSALEAQDEALPPAPPLAAQVGMPGHHELDVQVARDPTLPSILVRLYERREQAQLTNCTDIRVLDPQGPIGVNVTSVGNQPLGNHARHFIVGVLPLHGLEVLARTEANLSVCQNEWPLSAKSRAKIADFLARRSALIGAAPEPTRVPPSPAAAPSPPLPPSPPPETLFPPTPPTQPTVPSAPAPPATPPPSATPAPPPSATFPDAPPPTK